MLMCTLGHDLLPPPSNQRFFGVFTETTSSKDVEETVVLERLWSYQLFEFQRDPTRNADLSVFSKGRGKIYSTK